MDNFEVFTSIDKAKRDELFEALRNSKEPNERMVVKFSGQQPILGPDGKQDGYWKMYSASGKGGRLNVGKPQFRPAWQSNWSVAYPRELPPGSPLKHRPMSELLSPNLKEESNG